MIAALALTLGMAFQQDDREGWRPFVVPALSNERTAGSAIDLSWLNDAPAGAHGRLRADGDRIVDGRGVEVKLFGTNVTDFHAMPPKEVSPRLAKRLSELGMNFVRLHYFDWTQAPDGILAPDGESVDPGQLDLLHYLVHCLAQEGIYTNVNLHVARPYEGQPEDAHPFGKHIDRILRPYVESQKRYARSLLTPVNPYSGFSLAEDPAVAIVEINNENSVFDAWAALNHATLDGLPQELSEPLRVEWNAWLAKRYGDIFGLRRAWNSDEELGPNLLPAAVASIEVEANRPSGSSLVRGDDEFRWRVTRPGPDRWSHQLHVMNPPIAHGEPYVLEFELKGQAEALSVRFMHRVPPWGDVSPTLRVEPTSEWVRHRLAFRAQNPLDTPVRLSFDSENTPGVFEVRGLRLRRGQPQGIDEGVRLGEVSLATGASAPAVYADWVRFLGERDFALSQELKAFLVEELGVRAMILDTQVDYGGGYGARRASMVDDVIDAHAYPSHPRSIGRDEGRYVWEISQESLILDEPDALGWLAMHQMVGRPFMVSEFDLNPPNDFAAETLPVFSTMAALQGWDALAEYAYLNFRPDDWDPDDFHSPFTTSGHAGQMATFPTSALAFRLGWIDPLEATTTLDVTEPTLLESSITHDALSGLWQSAGVSQLDAWHTKTQWQMGDSDDLRLERDRTSPQVVRTSDRLLVLAPKLRMAIGAISGKTLELGDVTLRVTADTPRDYAHVTLAALDDRPIAESERLLLTTLFRVENLGQIFNEDRTSVGVDFGEGPTLAEPIPFELTLPPGDWRVFRLNGDGTRDSEIPAVDVLRVSRAQAGVWFLIERR